MGVEPLLYFFFPLSPYSGPSSRERERKRERERRKEEKRRMSVNEEVAKIRSQTRQGWLCVFIGLVGLFHSAISMLAFRRHMEAGNSTGEQEFGVLNTPIDVTLGKRKENSIIPSL